MGAAKPQLISFGKAAAIKWCVGPNDAERHNLKARTLYVDGGARESRLQGERCVARRQGGCARLDMAARRVVAGRPDDGGAFRRWRCQNSIPTIPWPVGIATMPPAAAFLTTAGNSSPSCFQAGRRRPVLKKSLGEGEEMDTPDPECPAPIRERRPVRVTFEPDEDHTFTYSVRGHAADLVTDDDVEEEKLRRS